MTQTTARTVRFHATGPASVLQIEEGPLPQPQSGEIRIKTQAIGLNRAEVMFRMGAYLEQPNLPSSLGYEASGVVDALGAGVEGFAVGDRVSTIPAFSMNEYGMYSDYPIAPVHAVAHTPDRLTPEEGASIWMQYITAYGGLIERGGMKSGASVLITAASSSVGLAAIQMVKAEGGLAIAATRGPEKVQALLDAGADHVIQTKTESLPDRVREITGDGVDLAFDPVAGPLLGDIAEAAARGARIIEYGALDDRPTPYPLLPALAKGLNIIGYTLFEVASDPAEFGRAKAYVTEKLTSGAFKPVIAKTFPFEDIQKAHEYMEAGDQFGKIVITV